MQKVYSFVSVYLSMLLGLGFFTFFIFGIAITFIFNNAWLVMIPAVVYLMLLGSLITFSIDKINPLEFAAVQTKIYADEIIKETNKYGDVINYYLKNDDGSVQVFPVNKVTSNAIKYTDKAPYIKVSTYTPKAHISRAEKIYLQKYNQINITQYKSFS